MNGYEDLPRREVPKEDWGEWALEGRIEEVTLLAQQRLSQIYN